MMGNGFAFCNAEAADWEIRNKKHRISKEIRCFFEGKMGCGKQMPGASGSPRLEVLFLLSVFRGCQAECFFENPVEVALGGKTQVFRYFFGTPPAPLGVVHAQLFGQDFGGDGGADVGKNICPCLTD